MKTLAEFWINESNIGEQEFVFVRNKSTWFGGRKTVPLDTPPCGFENELCQEIEKSNSTFTF